MTKELKILFSLKSTYKVNTILYILKRIPLIKKLLPDALYQSKDLKLFAMVLSGIWEFLSAFLGKFLYFFVLIFLPVTFFTKVDSSDTFLHMIFLLSLMGSVTNTYLLNGTKYNYYAVVLMRMNAKKYSLVTYIYSLSTLVIGFLIFGFIFGLNVGVPTYIIILIPFFVVGLKIIVTSHYIRMFKKTKKAFNENSLTIPIWLSLVGVTSLTYGLPFLGFTIPSIVILPIMILCILCGCFLIPTLIKFNDYREYLQQTYLPVLLAKDKIQEKLKIKDKKMIANDPSITSNLSGFEYLNDLFIKRHKKILWKSTKTISIVASILGIAIIGMALYFKEDSEELNSLLMSSLPYFVFIIYIINRGTTITRAMFINCDVSLLTYSFYRNPKNLLKLFRIRLREIIKINLIPSFIISITLTLLLFVSGGTDNIINYILILVTLPALSIFFSVHYLTLYYLLQPFNSGCELKSGVYQLATGATYGLCYMFIYIKIPTLIFGMVAVSFCIIYSILACLLVYKFGPKNFRIKN